MGGARRGSPARKDSSFRQTATPCSNYDGAFGGSGEKGGGKWTRERAWGEDGESGARGDSREERERWGFGEVAVGHGGVLESFAVARSTCSMKCPAEARASTVMLLVR